MINTLSEHVVNFKEELHKQKLISVSTDTQMVRKGVSGIKSIVATQHQKPVIKKYQLLLFPE
jgi:hypothetical protein